MALHFVDPSESGGGNDSNNGTTYALRKKLFSAVSTSPGDTVRVKASPDPYRVQGLNGTNANGTFTNLDDDIPISESICKLVHECDAAATASANVTCATSSSTFKGGTAGWQITVAAGFTTGMAAYGATVNSDYSNCDRISLWLYQSSGTAIPANTLDIRLCSDAAGAVVVDTFTIPFALASGSNTWIPLVLERNGGGALGASIQSLSIAFTSDPGAVVLFIDNIIATSAAGITHQSLVGKSSSATNIQFYPVRIIAPTNIKLDSDRSSNGSSAKRGYSGTTETVAIYARQPLITYSNHSTNANGASGNRITWSGGWNPTDMSTQTGVTYLLRLPPSDGHINLDNRSHLNVERLLQCGGNASFATNSTSSLTFTSCGAAGGSYGFFMPTAVDLTMENCVVVGAGIGFLIFNFITRPTFTNCEAYNCGTGFNLGGTYINNASATGLIANNNVNGIIPPAQSFQMPFIDCVAKDNTNGFSIGDKGTDVTIHNPTTSGNGVAFSLATGAALARVFGGTFSESTSALVSANQFARIRFHGVGGVQTDERERSYEGWTLKVDSSTWAGSGHTPTGSVWRLQPNSNATSSSPLISLFEPGVLTAGSYTVAIKAYRTNANVTGKLVVKGGRTDGITSDTSSSNISAAINTAETLSVSFTVATTGPVWLEFHSWFTSGSTGEVWFDEIGIT